MFWLTILKKDGLALFHYLSLLLALQSWEVCVFFSISITPGDETGFKVKLYTLSLQKFREQQAMLMKWQQTDQSHNTTPEGRKESYINPFPVKPSFS